MRFVVYTAVVGSYDKILQPDCIDEGFDYLFFSNDILCQQVGVWKIREIPYVDPDNTRVSRWVKTHPEELLSEYDASVWVDANVVILTSYIYERALELYSNGVFISSMCHCVRDCIYQEASFVAYRGIEKELIVLNWLRTLRTVSYPHHNGLFETNVLFRAHRQEEIITLDKEWWSIINQYSRRDQLSFNYCLWKLIIDCPFFISSTENVRNSEHFQYIAHKQSRIHFDSKNDIVHYCRALPWFNPERLRELYEKMVRYRGFLFFRAIVAFYYRVICYVIYLKQSLFLT